MFKLNFKGKIIVFSFVFLPFLVLMLLYSYVLWIPADSWFFNDNFLRIWFSIVFLGFFFIPFSEIILFEKRSVLERSLLILIFFFLGVDIIQYIYQYVYLEDVLAIFFMAIFLNFSFISLNNHSKYHLNKHIILNIVIIAMILISFFGITELLNINYIFINIVYILMISLIGLYLFKLRKEIY